MYFLAWIIWRVGGEDGRGFAVVLRGEMAGLLLGNDRNEGIGRRLDMKESLHHQH